MRIRMAVTVFGLALVASVVPLRAHHGSAGFDQKKPVHFTGKVSQLEWMNPHVVIHIDVTGAEGKVATWLVNTLPPNAAKRQGFSQNSFAVGTEISVDGYQAVDGSNHVNGTNIVLGDGQKIVTPDCFDNGPYCYKPVDGTSTRIH